MRRAFGLVLLIGLLAAPATARGEATGAPFQFSDGPVTGLRLASATPGRVLAHWGDLNGLAGRVLAPGGTAGEKLALPGKGCSGSQVVANPDGQQYLRVWNQRTVDADPVFGAGVLGQLQTAAGQPIGTPFRIAAAEMGFCNYEVTTVWNPVKSAFLVAYRRAAAGGGSAYFGQLVSAEGSLSGAPFEISRGNVGKPAVAVFPTDGTIAAVWSAVVAGGTGDAFVVERQLLTSDGAKSGGVTTIADKPNAAGAVQNLDPQIVVNPETSQTLIAWNDRFEIYGRLYAPNGSPEADQAKLSAIGTLEAGSLSSSPNLAYNPDSDQYLVTWQSQRPSVPLPSGVQVYGQLLDEDAIEVGRPDFPISTTGGAAEPRAVAVDQRQSFIVGWENRVGAVTGVARNVEPTFDVRILGEASLGNFAFRGLRVRVLCPIACRTRVRLIVSRQTARRLRTSREFDVERDLFGGGSLDVRLRAPRGLTAKLQRLGRLNATLRVYAKLRDGRVRGLSRRVRLVP